MRGHMLYAMVGSTFRSNYPRLPGASSRLSYQALHNTAPQSFVLYDRYFDTYRPTTAVGQMELMTD